MSVRKAKLLHEDPYVEYILMAGVRIVHLYHTSIPTYLISIGTVNTNEHTRTRTRHTIYRICEYIGYVPTYRHTDAPSETLHAHFISFRFGSFFENYRQDKTFRKSHRSNLIGSMLLYLADFFFVRHSGSVSAPLKICKSLRIREN